MLANFKKQLMTLSRPKFIGYALVGLIASLSAISTGLRLNETGD
jgi:hypothetical protein